jgi:hypothetical protein
MPDTDKLNSAIDSFSEQSYGSEQSEGILSTQRALALDAFAGKSNQIDPAAPGRSSVGDWSVFETVNWILPSLCRIFAGGDSVIEFEPTDSKDEDAAKQESMILNHVVLNKNNWFLTCLTWFQDALVTSNAYCMTYMEEKITPEVERYEQQTMEQVAMILEDDVEIVGQEQTVDEENLEPVGVDEMGEPVLGPKIRYDLEVKRVTPTKRLRFRVLPPERCKVGEDTSDFTLETANYFEFWENVPISDIRKEGYEIDDYISDDPYTDTEEDIARDDLLESDTDIDTPDPAMRQVLRRHIWIRHDYDEDGIAELQYVMRIGREILDRYEVSNIPVASIVPFINTHRHIGISVADLVFDVQRIKTQLLRLGLDSLNLSVAPRHAVSTEVHLDDLLTVRPGGIVRLKNGAIPGQGHIMPLPTEFVFPQAQEGLAHMDSVIDSRTGVNKMFQGIDASAMSSTNAHNAIGQLSTMASQRVEQIARVFANGIERLFRLSHELLIKSGHSEQSIKLRGEWVDVNPNQWKTGRDMRIVAPFAAGNKDSLLQRLMLIAQRQDVAIQTGSLHVDPDDRYMLDMEIASAADVPGDRFFTDPATVQPPPPPPDYTAIALEIEQSKVTQQSEESQLEAQLKEADSQREAEIKRYQVDTNAQLQLALAQIKQEGAVDLAKVQAFLKEAPAFMAGVIEKTGNQQSQLQEAADRLAETLEALRTAAEQPRELVREDGKIIGVRVNGETRRIQRDGQGNITGLT